MALFVVTALDYVGSMSCWIGSSSGDSCSELRTESLLSLVWDLRFVWDLRRTPLC